MSTKAVRQRVECNGCKRPGLAREMEACYVCFASGSDDEAEAMRCSECAVDHGLAHTAYEEFKARAEMGIVFVEFDSDEDLLDYYETIEDRAQVSSRMADTN